jgi:mannose-6-phosphate isomerase-like protein (cupin superfamily)
MMNSTNRLSVKKPIPDFVIQSISRNMAEDPLTGWHRQILFLGPTSYLDELCIHAGVLSAHVAPHPPHCHEHEEVHISLSETLEFVVCEAGSVIENASSIDNGSVFFTDSSIPHSFRNTASQPAAYLHFRWKNGFKTFGAGRKPLQFYYSPLDQNKTCGHSVYNGIEIDEIYSGPSRYLSRLRAIFMSLKDGDVIPLHRHPHEVIFILVKGSIEILGRKLDAPGFAFLGTQVPHHIINRGPDSAHLYAFELHQEV